MFGPPALTHFVYVVLVIAFVCVIGYMFAYNLRLKARLKELEQRGYHPQTKQEEIIAEEHAEDARHKRR
jgi:Tfp pilus assembly protein PilO